MGDSPFDILVGRELDAVSFVRDYVELHIDYSVVRLLTEPEGFLDGESWRLTDFGGADTLRRYIGRTIVATEFDEHERVRLEFEDGSNIQASLRDDDRVGPEALHLMPADASGQVHAQRMWIW